MTDTEINTAIAEACGWTDCEECSCGTKITAWPPFYSGHKKHIPDYCNDLNAMHEAEEALNYRELCDMEESIQYHHAVTPFRATARQRAEAFLRTIGKWKEVEL